MYEEIDYKNRNILTDFVFNFWNNWGAFNYDERFDEEIKAEIWNNLNNQNGIEKEIDYVRQEFESGWDENSLEYKNLTELWDYLNYYKTSFQKGEVLL